MSSFTADLFDSFYSQSFYARLARRAHGIGLSFIILVVTLALVTFITAIAVSFPSSQDAVAHVLGQFPEVTLVDQKLSMDKASPYTVELDGNDKAAGAIVFDTTPRAIEAEGLEKHMQDAHMIALVTSDFVAIHKPHSVEIHNFSDYKSLLNDKIIVGHDQWLNFAKKILMFGVPATIFVLFVGYFVIALADTFLRALIIKFMALFTTVKPTFAGAMRVSAAANIPASLLTFSLAEIGLMAGQPANYALPRFVSIIVAVGYGIYGLLCADKEKKLELH